VLSFGIMISASIRKLRRLRADIQKGLRSIDAGKGRKLNIDEFLRRARKRFGKS